VQISRKDLETQASHASINHLLGRTVGVINQIRVQIAPTRDTEVAGTGSLVEWNGRRLVITAKHVIDNVKSPSDVRIAAYEDQAVVFKPPESVTAKDAYAGLQLGPDSRFTCARGKTLRRSPFQVQPSRIVHWSM
jgi:hypothetical protein